MTDLLALLAGVCRSGDGWTARCPAHDDQHQSLSVHHRDGKWLIKCHAGCDWREIISALGLAEFGSLRQPFKRGGGQANPPRSARNRAIVPYFDIAGERRGRADA